MSKLVAFLVAAAGASTVSVGGTFLLKKGGGQGTDGNTAGKVQNHQNTTPETNNLDFESLVKFKEGNGGSCVTKTLGSASFATDNKTELNASNSIQSTHFTSDTQGDVHSCLVINGQKSSATDGKGKGHFRGLGSFVKGTKAMVVFTTTKLPTQEQKMGLEGGIYFLTKDNSSGNWSVDKYKERPKADSAADMDGDKLDEGFPKKGEGISESDLDSDNKEYWSFVSGTEDVKKVCKESDKDTCAKDATSNEFKRSGMGTPDNNTQPSGKEISKWADKFSENITKIFGAEVTLTGVFDTFKGTGTKQNS